MHGVMDGVQVQGLGALSRSGWFYGDTVLIQPIRINVDVARPGHTTVHNGNLRQKRFVVQPGIAFPGEQTDT